ncbi:MAG: prephenate dehydrogenase, partial [Clostridia bacterium]|nr:prephenate dehydrogenase [Clostridia bacterium]
DIGTLDMLRELFLAAGFEKITFCAPETHDEIIACTSHLPHVISSAFVKSPTALRHNGFSAGSFRDISRVSTLDEDLWAELFLMNSENLARELELFMRNLAEYLEAVKNKDAEKLRTLLREGRECKAAAGGVGNG